MAATGTLNVRLPEDLKRHGGEVLARGGVSVSQAVRCLFEHLEQTQEIPSWMDAEPREDAVAARRQLLRSLVGMVDLPEGYDARQDYRAHLLARQAFGGER